MKPRNDLVQILLTLVFLALLLLRTSGRNKHIPHRETGVIFFKKAKSHHVNTLKTIQLFPII